MRNWKTWLKCALIRSVKTIAQTMVATIGTATVMGDVNWTMVISASILAGILSMLTSLARNTRRKRRCHINTRRVLRII